MTKELDAAEVAMRDAIGLPSLVMDESGALDVKKFAESNGLHPSPLPAEYSPGTKRQEYAGTRRDGASSKGRMMKQLEDKGYRQDNFGAYTHHDSPKTGGIWITEHKSGLTKIHHDPEHKRGLLWEGGEGRLTGPASGRRLKLASGD
jgi:hypothetical protein